MNCFGPLTILSGKDGSPAYCSCDHSRKLGILHDLDIYYIRQLAHSVQSKTLKEKLEIEIKMREGILKLMNLCRHVDQSLEASKNLMLSEERMVIYMDEMMRLESELESEKSCSSGKICVSNIRIPLIWKEAEHFKHEGGQGKYFVFCLLKTNNQVFSTKILGPIDGSFTDITFEDVIVFDTVDYSFALKLELFMYLKQGRNFLVSNIKEAFQKPINWKIGKRLANAKGDGMNLENFGMKFTMIAARTFTVKDVDPFIRSYDLTLYDQDNSLPLFGYVCLRVACKPDSMDSIKLECGLRISKYQLKKYPKLHKFYMKLDNFVLKAWETADSSEPADTEPYFSISVNDIHILLSNNPKRFTMVHAETRYKLVFPSIQERTKWYNSIQSCAADCRNWYQGSFSPTEFLPSPKAISANTLRRGENEDSTNQPTKASVLHSDCGTSSAADGLQSPVFSRRNSTTKFCFSRNSLRCRLSRKF